MVEDNIGAYFIFLIIYTYCDFSSIYYIDTFFIQVGFGRADNQHVC